MLKNLILLKYLLLGFIILLSKICIAQNILDIFETLPDSVVLNLSIEERKLITSISKDNKNATDAKADLNLHKTNYAFEQVDLKNAYLKLIGNFEGHLQICYWKLPENNKLIAVYKETCGPVCSAIQLNFYLFNKAKIFDERRIINVLPLKEIEQKINDELYKRCGKIDTNCIDKLLYQYQRNGNDMELIYNDETSNSIDDFCSNVIKIKLSLLKENLKNTTYFGIKK